MSTEFSLSIPARYDGVVTVEMFTVELLLGKVTLAVDAPLALHALGERIVSG